MQTEMQTAFILIRLFLFRPVLFAQKNCKVAAGYGGLLYPLFRKKNRVYFNFVPKSVRRPSVRASVCLSVRPSVTFLVIVSSPKRLDVATSNFVGA